MAFNLFFYSGHRISGDTNDAFYNVRFDRFMRTGGRYAVRFSFVSNKDTAGNIIINPTPAVLFFKVPSKVNNYLTTAENDFTSSSILGMIQSYCYDMTENYGNLHSSLGENPSVILNLHPDLNEIRITLTQVDTVNLWLDNAGDALSEYLLCLEFTPV